MTGITRMTRITGMIEINWMTGTTGMSRITGMTEMNWMNWITRINNNYSPKWRWLVLDMYRTAKQ